MAIYHTNEDIAGGSYTNGIQLVSATNISTRVVFDYSGPLNNATLTSTFVNTAGAGLSSGAGKIVFDTTYSNDIVYIVLPDRSSFAAKLPGTSTAVTLTATGFGHWGPKEVRLRNLGYF